MIYYDLGVDKATIDVWNKFFEKYYDLIPTQLTSGSLTYSKLKNADLVIMPGGNSHEERMGLTHNDKENLKQYLSEGGHLLGVCAGAFLVSSGDRWSLDIVDASQDREKNAHLSPDILNLDFNTTDLGKQVFGTSDDTVNLNYHGGPVITTIGTTKPLLTFGEEVPHDDTIEDFSKGQVASLLTTYGEGVIILISPHIEKTPKYTDLLYNCINYLLTNKK
jgi:uncharacterized protein YciI